MVIEYSYKVGIEDVGRDFSITNKTILRMMEEAGGFHSAECGSGLLDIEKNQAAWAVLNWKVRIFSRPLYGEDIIVRTWSAKSERILAIRDFELVDSKGNVFAVGSSRWIFMDLLKRRPQRITEEMMIPFQSEDRNVFNNKIVKLNTPDADFEEINYEVQKRDIDYLGHMHNLNYLDIVSENLSEEYRGDCDAFEIEYRKEIMRSDNLKLRIYPVADLTEADITALECNDRYSKGAREKSDTKVKTIVFAVDDNVNTVVKMYFGI